MNNKQLYLLSQYQRYYEFARPHGVRIQFDDNNPTKEIECAIIRSHNDTIFRRCYSIEEVVGFLAGLVENSGGWDDKD